VLLFGLVSSLKPEGVPVDILELGTGLGGTSNVLAWLPWAKIKTVEIRDSEAMEASENLKEFSNIEFIKEDSLEYIQKCEDASFDFILVDDCHIYSHELEEAKEAKRVIRPGGIIGFHDVLYPEYYPLHKVLDIFEDWEKIFLPSWISLHVNTGLAITRRPV